MSQCADRIKGQVTPQLQPDFRADIIEDPRLKASLFQQCRYPAHTFTFLTTQFSNRKSIAFYMPYNPRLDDSSRRIGDTTYQAVRIYSIE